MYGVALLAETRSWGLFKVLETPLWLAIAAAVIVLDLAIYFQHVLFHAVPVLWRLHRMHHADLELDVTTGTRFHPLEIGSPGDLQGDTVKRFTEIRRSYVPLSRQRRRYPSLSG